MDERRILVATLRNHLYPPNLAKMVRSIATDFGAQVRQKEIGDMLLGDDSSVETFNPKSKYEIERNVAISRRISSAQVANISNSLQNSSTQNRTKLDFTDVEWANSIIFFTPTYHKMVPPKLRNLISYFKSPNYKKHIKDKPITAVTYTSNGDSSGRDLAVSLYIQFMEVGAIPISPPQLEQNTHRSSEHRLAYHHTVGTDIDLWTLTAQIERLIKIAETLSTSI